MSFISSLFVRPRFPNLLANAAQLRQYSSEFSSLPIIDIAPLVNRNSALEQRQAVARQLHDACLRVGFFYVKNHGVPAGISQGVLQEARHWFDLPENVKRQIEMTEATHFRGYQVLGSNVTRYEGGYQRDWHEAIDLYKEEPATTKQAGSSHSPVHGPNQWPHQRPQFEAALRLYVDSMRHVGSDIMRGIALGLGLQEDFFGGARAGVNGSYWITRVIHYPPLVAAAEAAAEAAAGAEVERSVQLSCGEHTDYGLLTLVNQEPDVTALQVKNSAGRWVDATPLPGTFVCNVGDMLKVWTNGMYVPTAHRVVNMHPTRSRVSIPFFFEPCFEAVVEPVPQLCGASGPLFKPIRYGTHLESKVLTNFEL